MMLNLVTFMKYIGVFVILISLATIAYGFITKSKVEKEREQLMKGIVNVAIGAFILGSIVIIAGFFLQTQSNIMQSMPTSSTPTIPVTYSTATDQGTIIEHILAEPFSSFNNFILGDANGNNGVWGLVGLDSIDNLIFNQNNDSVEVPPFNKQEWYAINVMYKVTMTISIILIVMMIGMAGIKYSLYSTNPIKLQEVKTDMNRWIFIILINAGGILFIKISLGFFGYLSTILYDNIANGQLNSAYTTTLPGTNILVSTSKSTLLFKRAGLVSSLKTGNILVTQVLIFFYALLCLKINVSFIARKWVLIIMASCTPLVSALWGMNKKVHAFDIWFGEILSNAAMGFSYAITFSALSLVISGSSNFIFIFIGMSMSIKLAEVIRNSLQGFITKLSGVDEMSAGIGGLGQGTAILKGMYNAFKAGASGGGGNNGGMFAGVDKMGGGFDASNVKDSAAGAASTVRAASTSAASSLPSILSKNGSGSSSGVIVDSHGNPLSSSSSADTIVETSSANSESSTGGDANGSTYEQLSKLQKEDDQNISMLANNYSGSGSLNGEMHGANAAFLATGNDKTLSSVGSLISDLVHGSVNGINMAKALYTTSGQIAMKNKMTADGYKYDPNSKITNDERMSGFKQLTGQYSYDKSTGNYTKTDSTGYSAFKGARLVSSAFLQNGNSVNKIIMKDHISSAYNRNVGFNGWNTAASQSKSK